MEDRPAEDYAELSTLAHGRREERRISLWHIDEPLTDLATEWRSLRSFVRVQRRRTVGSTTADASPEWTTHSYISSRRDLDARQLGGLIQSHWQIENRLHWVKNVIQHEDRNAIAGANAPENLSLLKTIALNLYRSHGFDSIKHATSRFANKIKELFRLFLRT